MGGGVDGALAHELGNVFVGGLFVASEVDEGIAVAHQGFPTVLEQSFQLGHVLDDDGHGDFPAAHGGQQLFKIVRQGDVGKLVHQEMHMDRQPAAVLPVGQVVELLESLGVEHPDQVVKGGVVVGDAAVHHGLSFADGRYVHLVKVRHARHLGQVEGRQPDAHGHEDGLRRFARRHLEDAVLLHSDVVGVAHLQILEQQVEVVDVVLVFFLDIRSLQHLHDRRKVALVLGRAVNEKQDQGFQQGRLRLLPEGVVVAGVLRRGVLDEIRHQPQHVVVSFDVLQGIVAPGLIHVDEIDHLHVVAEALHQLAGVPADLALRVGDDERGVALKHIGLGVEAGLARAGAADDQHVQVAAVRVAVQAEAHAVGQQNVFGRVAAGVFLVDLLCISPASRTVFLQRLHPAP